MKKYSSITLAFLFTMALISEVTDVNQSSYLPFSVHAKGLAQKYIYAAGLHWDKKVVELSWYEALKYCRKSRRRLPTREELVKGYKSGVLALRQPASGYWSSTPYFGFPAIAWRVNFSSGGVYYDGKTDNNYVRCVNRLR